MYFSLKSSYNKYVYKAIKHWDRLSTFSGNKWFRSLPYRSLWLDRPFSFLYLPSGKRFRFCIINLSRWIFAITIEYLDECLLNMWIFIGDHPIGIDVIQRNQEHWNWIPMTESLTYIQPAPLSKNMCSHFHNPTSN